MNQLIQSTLVYETIFNSKNEKKAIQSIYEQKRSGLKRNKKNLQ